MCFRNSVTFIESITLGLSDKILVILECYITDNQISLLVASVPEVFPLQGDSWKRLTKILGDFEIIHIALSEFLEL